MEIGDTQSASENLRRFFDQRFSENDESCVLYFLFMKTLSNWRHPKFSGFTQHALLNVARLHYSLGENLAAVNVSPAISMDYLRSYLQGAPRSSEDCSDGKRRTNGTALQ